MHLPNIKWHMVLKVFEAALVTIFLGILLHNQWQHEKGLILDKLADHEGRLLKLVTVQAQLSSMIKKIDDIEERNLVMKVLINSKKLTADQVFELSDIIPERCKALGIPTKGFLSIMIVESEFNPKCIFAGAKGICQVKECTKLEAIGATETYKWDDPITNTLACLLYLEYIKSLPKYKGADFLTVAAAWNRGPFREDIRDSIGRAYVRKIEYHMARM